jgi:CRISPR-associated protein Cas1
VSTATDPQLEASSGGEEDVPRLLPVRILNEHIYCPRLAYLEWVDRQFEDNLDTAEGAFAHRRAHKERGTPPGPEGVGEDAPPSTAVTLSSQELGLIAKIDVLEPRGKTVVPVEYKRGSPRSGPYPLWEPEAVQLCAQALLLREAGYRVEEAEAYFIAARVRRRIPISDALIRKTLRAIGEVRVNATKHAPPPPLVDSPKCPRCSLIGICLPDEVNALRLDDRPPARRLVAGDSPAKPLYATEQGTRLSKRGSRVVQLRGEREEVASARLIDVSQISVFGNVNVGSALLRACFEAGIPVLWFTYGGWLRGHAAGPGPGNVGARIRQHRAAQIGEPWFASSFVAGKILNCRTLLRRHAMGGSKRLLNTLAALARSAERERSIDSLLGIEGTAARLYFKEFGKLLRRPADPLAFSFEQRNRRPPRDPVNALLSFAYALLLKDVTAALIAAGLEPDVGFFHKPRFGRPALALDLAEEFRPLIADSVVLTAVNNGEVQASDFVARAGGVSLTSEARRRFTATYERRMRTELRHPLFGYGASYRRTLEIQARLLASVLVGDAPAYRSLTTR